MNGDEQQQAGGDFFRGGGAGPSMEDIFGDFSSFFNMGGDTQRVQRGEDIQINMEIQFMEAVNGANKKIQFDRKTKCTVCNGSKCKPGTSPTKCGTCGGKGTINIRQGPMIMQMMCDKCMGVGEIIKNQCTTCRGEGIARTKTEEEVTFPKGVNHGQSLRISRKGNAGKNNGPLGDLIIKVSVRPDPYFGRDNYDIITTQYITLTDAVLGNKIKIKTLSGEKELEIKPGTQHGEQIRIKGQGICNLPPNQNDLGDHIVNLKIYIPKNINKQQKEAFENLQKVEDKINPELNLNTNNQQQKQQQQRRQQQSQQRQQQEEDDMGHPFFRFKNMWGK
ncbi:hypothetical protein IMG5_108560 [Ichthyophthirius multifiliis]|uniref:CR-type domain-containing protein n=1 Tax=Ichthyophthirius multifiliis TaxID=5932 RepID=G0QTH6_ICHMU|nr:hypothetical protein IMG5_108560 [Ichthyophthirius multifiliis]EGR31479.1 hypothetical protein IMG5_108560 [Ichthyophthirius multifiliis]|eukprot:XP_004034965.1 hypothetical protein IMG5_108560 [Ichthyophthirius multifiliis]